MYATMHAWSENKISLAVMRLRSLTAYAALVSFCETCKLTILSPYDNYPKGKKDYLQIWDSATDRQTYRPTTKGIGLQ